MLCPKSLCQKQQHHSRIEAFEKYGIMIFRSFVTIGIIVGIARVISQEDAIEELFFFSLVIQIVQILYLYYFIKTKPNFHQFALKCSNGTLDYKFIRSILSYTRYCEEILFDMVRFLFFFNINYPRLPSPNIKVMSV